MLKVGANVDTFSDRLNRALEARHITAAELARKIGVDEATISNYRKGKYKPKQDRTEEIAIALNVSLAYLLGAGVEMGLYGQKNATAYSPNSYILNDVEMFIIDTYRQADGRQKSRFCTLATEIADKLEKNNSLPNCNGACG